jgi:hypothetical protein
MIARLCLFIALIAPLGGCIAIPDNEVAQRINFDYSPPQHQPMSYDDTLCCYRCEA